ncbi:type IV secretory system conjugative DNA transfer family protein [Peribacillus muralis]|uniref:VirD4-like conjugal transfer protein, CD1115 family n=1 Tax=Peribacillus muralis TaxID=264697 RepID=UPI001F4DC1B5|nr:type IV secretory system conjugative DNA transfer family protein [Peribacillus muralis]MCK1995446.1 type IV secretory system conjugative DNA transfer family protein [Peribacillus muralis]MCK2016029.1 type IV secretory system conjugative DNA transfer family protein [Peribacillus muralis]
MTVIKEESTSGIVMGVKDGKILIQHENSKLANRNQYIVGGPGSFKTQSFVLTNMINITDCSIVVTDPKGEVYEKTAKIKEAQGYEVRVVNFKNMALSDHYNPFGYVRRDLDATTVANTIVSAKNDPKRKDIWFNAQLGLLKALILYVKTEFHPDKRNMEGILDFLQEFDPEVNEDGDSELDSKFMALDKRHPARRSYELGFKKSQEKTRTSIIISLLTTIGDYVDDEVAAFTSNIDFFFEDIGTRKVALYVLIPTMDTTWEGLINLFFSQMFQELYILGDKNGAKLPVPTVFLLDEFPNLGKFENYETFLATCRGYRIACCTILQNNTQLMDKYGKDKAESILGNCAIKICLGNVNDTTAAYFSNLMGKTTVKVDTGGRSVSKGGTGNSSSSSNFSFSQRSLMNADEILTMSEKDSLVLIAGKYPIKAKKAIQFELYPGLVEEYEVSQMDYERKTSPAAQEEYENLVHIFESQREDLEELGFEEDQEIEEQSMAETEQDEVLAQAREEIEMYQNSLSVLEAMSEDEGKFEHTTLR